MSPQESNQEPPSIEDCIKNKPEIARGLSATSLIGGTDRCIASSTAAMANNRFYTEGFSVLYSGRTGQVFGTSESGYSVDTVTGDVTPRP